MSQGPAITGLSVTLIALPPAGVMLEYLAVLVLMLAPKRNRASISSGCTSPFGFYGLPAKLLHARRRGVARRDAHSESGLGPSMICEQSAFAVRQESVNFGAGGFPGAHQTRCSNAVEFIKNPAKFSHGCGLLAAQVRKNRVAFNGSCDADANLLEAGRQFLRHCVSVLCVAEPDIVCQQSYPWS